MFRSKEDVEKIQVLEYENNRLTKKLESYLDTKKSDAKRDLNGSIFEFDFAALDAFSIERITEDREPHTVIGYIRGHDDNGSVQIGQWIFYCSQTEHNRLAEKFRVYYEATLHNKRLNTGKKK